MYRWISDHKKQLQLQDIGSGAAMADIKSLTVRRHFPVVRPGRGVLLPAQYEPLCSVRLNGRFEAAEASHRTTAIGAETAVSIASGERSAFTALPAKSLQPAIDPAAPVAL